MNITGSITNIYFHSDTKGDGAFSAAVQNYRWLPSAASENGGRTNINFNAENGWSGETSYVGSGAAQNNMQPYLSVYMWRRTA